jgi:hypothetical protein
VIFQCPTTLFILAVYSEVDLRLPIFKKGVRLCFRSLVEHLAGNKDLAYSYEEKGLSLFRQVGLLDTLPSEHSYRVIDRMKREGMW